MQKERPLYRNWKLYAALLALAILGYALLPSQRYEYQSSLTEAEKASFDTYLQDRLQESAQKNARQGNEEKLIRYGEKTPIAFLYVHGFGASRAEGEMVMDQVAATLKANTFYLRLPGHGTNKEDHASVVMSDYLNYSIDALKETQKLGDQVIVVGTSMGGLIATYLAAHYPEDVDALILASPFYDFRDKTGNVLGVPGGLALAELVNGGEIRDSSRDPKNPRSVDGYENYWYTVQYMSALVPLYNLKEYVARPATFRAIRCPTLLFYYYKNEEEQDPTADVDAMLEAFHQFGGKDGPNPLNRAVAIEDGSHVLMSEYVRTDKERILKEILQFVQDFQNQKAEH
ncbi:MAG: alpha/beta fold hydrolase [Leptospiraceae bacterium]|nr:alpha/beta fold hydrolase [Leptospiraceae bacterium]